MKRIVFLIPSLGMGGMERVLVNYANLFAARGYDVTVLNFTYDDDAITSGFSQTIHYIKNYSPVKNIKNAAFAQILKGNFRLLPQKIWMKFHSAKYLYKKYIKENFDVEIAFFGMDAMKIISGSTNESAVKIGWLHYVNLEDDIKNVGSYNRAKKIYNEISEIICVSQKSKDELNRVFGREKNVFVVNNPNDTKKIRDSATADFAGKKYRFTFAVVARIDEYNKAFLRLLSVCSRLNSEGYDYNLWIVGDGKDSKLIKDKARELNLNNVIFYGKQANPYPYIYNADMYLCASKFEGFSMVMMESIILGTPILSTDVSGADEMLDGGKYGMIVENSENGIYEGMKKILDNPDMYSHYKAMADKRKDYLSEEKIMDQVENIIKGL
ncbi:MAG: glycosyltransferase [Clostridia bacterium]|nr:glycosyltransferase [Clostridia bacterium]